MDKDTTIIARQRDKTGSGAMRRLRAEGRLPAALNDVDGASLAIDCDRHAFELLLHHHTGERILLDVEVEGQRTRKALLKDVQRDPVTGALLHVDFLEVSMTEKLRTTVTVELVGDPVGVEAGGILEHLVREIEVECLPADLVEQIEVDVSALNIGDRLLVSDLSVPDGLTILTAHDVAVAAVGAPRIEEEPVKEEEGAEGEKVEPEVVGEKKEKEKEEE